MDLRHYFAVALLLALSPSSIFANSYAFATLPKGELPEKAAKFHSRSTSWGKENEEQLSRSSLNQFLAHGAWHGQNPYYVEMKKLGPQWNNWYQFKDLPEEELTDTQKKILETQDTYNREPTLYGAFTNETGRVFLFRLRSPRFLEVQTEGCVCYLVLESEKQIELDLFEGERALAESPNLNPDLLTVSRGPLPATGSYTKIPKAILAAFLEEGNVTGKKTGNWRWQQPDSITSYWVVEAGLGKRRDGRPSLTLEGTVNGYFHGDGDQLWFCELFSDDLLLLDNGEGQYAILQYPKASPKDESQ